MARVEPNQMGKTAVNISVSSERQAMDWSLVLASQGISATILRSEETGQWFLVVDAHDHPAAVAALRQYYLENRGLRWRSQLPWTDSVFHWGGVLWCIYLLVFYAGEVFYGQAFKAAGMMDSAAVKAGQWWRLFSAVSLHGSVGHLAANLSTGFLLLGLAMARYGAGPGLLAAYLSGAGGNLIGLLLYDHPYQGLGASGMVMGALGLISVQSLSLWRKSPHATTYILSGIFAGLMLLVLLGLDPSSDVIAHVGGFFVGGLLGGLLALLPPALIESQGINLASNLGLMTLVIWPWWKALL
jgi:membrane associated rhomboid family serine protease